MTSRPILLIIGLTFLTFGNSLLGGFTGDAYSLFVENRFYENPANVAKVFTSQLVMTPQHLQQGFNTHPQEYTGFVSYRPVTALSFFCDFFIWGRNPFGYHLVNLILHLAAAWLVYYLALAVTRTKDTALLAGILFGIHPIQAEVVNSIGYRSDILAAVFYLTTILAYQQFRVLAGGRRGIFLGLSLLSFGLSLFSKESALTLPLVLFLYDYWFLAGGGPIVLFLRQRGKVMLAYASVYLFYLYLYFQMMPNIFYSHYRPLGDWPAQVRIMGEIFFRYLTALFLPWQTDILPPLYAPAAESVPLWHGVLALIFVVVAMLWAARRFPQNRVYAFGVMWFLVTYLPTTNILTLLNPFAYRFMYLPSIGFFILAAWGIGRLGRWSKAINPSARIGEVFFITLVVVCLSVTIYLNPFFKDNFSACREMVRRYPESSRPYWLLGLLHFRQGEYGQALSSLEQYLERKPNLPFIPDPKQDYAVYHLMGRSYVDDPDRAVDMFAKVIALKPDFALVYADMAKAYILKNDFPGAIETGRQAVSLESDLVIAYVYVIHSYLALNEVAAANEWLAKVMAIDPNDSNVQYVKDLVARHGIQQP